MVQTAVGDRYVLERMLADGAVGEPGDPAQRDPGAACQLSDAPRQGLRSQRRRGSDRR